MFETDDGQKLHSVVMIDEERDNLHYFRKVFHHLPDIKFFTMSEPNLGIITALQYQADVIVTEIYYPGHGYFDGELLIEELRRARPEAKIIIYSVHGNEDIVCRYTTVFGVDAYLKKIESNLEEVVRKVFDLLGRDYPFSA